MIETILQGFGLCENCCEEKAIKQRKSDINKCGIISLCDVCDEYWDINN